MLRKLKINLQMVVNSMKQQADRGWIERAFQVGDLVFLKLQSYQQSTMEVRRSEKLSLRYFGSYEVIA